MADEGAAGRRVRVHVKNNHARPGGWPNSAEGEDVFTITPTRYQAAAARLPGGSPGISRMVLSASNSQP